MDETAPPKKKSLWSFVRIILLVAILAAAFAGYTRYFMTQRTGGQLVNENIEVLDARLQNLENGILRHEQRIKELEETVQKLSSAPASAPAAASATPSPAPAGTASTTGGDERIVALEKEIAALKAASPLGDGTKISQSIRLLSAFHRLSDKVLSGKPFATELASFEELAPTDQTAGSPISTLAPFAESGIPTFATLLVTFDQAVENLNSAQAVPPPNADFWQRFKYNLAHLVTIRRVDEMQTGNGTDIIVSRAQAKLEREDVEAAVAEIKQLPDAARSNFAAWLDDAQMVTDAPSLIDQLEEQVMQKAFHSDAPAATAPAPAQPATTPAQPVPAPSPAADDDSTTQPAKQ